MPLTDKAALSHLAHALGKATGLSVRVAEQGRVTDYFSSFHLHPVPAADRHDADPLHFTAKGV